MRNTVSKIAVLSLATAGLGFVAPALAAEEEVTPLEKQTEIQENAPSEIQGQQAAQQQDALVATVGDEKITRSDVMDAITELPPQVRQTPPQMLFPAVLDQLVTRELIVQEARAANLQDDPEVTSMTDAQTEDAREQAMVQVWLRRELEDRITDEQVQATVDELKAANPQVEDTPGLTQQVKQALQVQAIADISDELRKSAEVTFYDPAGQPVEGAAQVGQGAEAEQGQATQNQATQNQPTQNQAGQDSEQQQQ